MFVVGDEIICWHGHNSDGTELLCNRPTWPMIHIRSPFTIASVCGNLRMHEMLNGRWIDTSQPSTYDICGGRRLVPNPRRPQAKRVLLFSWWHGRSGLASFLSVFGFRSLHGPVANSVSWRDNPRIALQPIRRTHYPSIPEGWISDQEYA
jgi:hypothetical protein